MSDWRLMRVFVGRAKMTSIFGWERVPADDLDELAEQVQLCAEELIEDEEDDVGAIVARELLDEDVAGPRRRLRFDVAVTRSVRVDTTRSP